MTLSRTALALVSLAMIATTSYAQPITIPAQLNDLVTRVPFSMPQQPSGTGLNTFNRPIYVNGTYGSNFSLCASTTSKGFGEYLTPGFLRTSLLSVISGRGAAQLQALIQQIQSETDRRRRFALIFAVAAVDLARLSETTGGFTAEEVTGGGGIGAAWEQLRLGQEVRISGPSCYTADQVDQINAQALGAIQAVRQALAPPPAQATQKPAIPGMGIGIQKPQ